MPGGGSIISSLTPLTEFVAPENILYEDERIYMGNLAFSLSELHTPSLGLRFLNPVEYAYASTKDLPNDLYIVMQRYPNLPYWNMYYSNHYIEDMSMFAYTKTGAHHVFRYYGNAIAHMMTEDVASKLTGYRLCHTVCAFTY